MNSFSEGRRLAMERRRALAQGRAALPPSRDRTRVSRDRLGGPAPEAASQSAAALAPAPAAAAPVVSASAATSSGFTGGLTGRIMSMLRRRQLSAGKAALATAAAGPNQSPPLSVAAASAPAVASTAEASPEVEAAPLVPEARMSGAQVAKRLRAERAREKALAQAASPRPTRPPRQGRLDYPPKVVVDSTAGGQRVTGLKYTESAKVTGAEQGLGKPISGTQYISPRDAAMRPPAPKVTQSTTPGGHVVTGTHVRTRVPITGDEAGERQRITGDLDGKVEDDVTARERASYDGVAQFARQANPHGHSVFGTNLGRSLVVAGSRVRDRQRPIELTEGGHPISGTAVGRSARVTGDEAGSCRVVTGDQYLAPAARQAECGGAGGGTAAAPSLGYERRDPVTGAKVTVSSSWSGAKITGTGIDHDPDVTGDEAGSCRVITGTPYQSPETIYGYCAPEEAQAAEARRGPREPRVYVSGDLPLDSEGVTGTERGADRAITGTPYYEPLAEAPSAKDKLASIAARFSISTPQRRAQLEHRVDPLAAPSAEARITGSFAQGEGKITGNVEFHFAPRRAPQDRDGRPKISGEGGTKKARITGDAWVEHALVTGTEGYIAHERNPSERGQGKPQAFAGTRFFKSKAQHEEPRQIVTGMVGWSPKSAAKVTLSGGAQG
ncbi:MAG: CsoS2 family carboxysome shell protein [Casimicrobiaceae bacterium]|nr:CsoS2 family carboxysome shell protein [Casimicrobiaceae bacterium]